MLKKSVFLNFQLNLINSALWDSLNINLSSPFHQIDNLIKYKILSK